MVRDLEREGALTHRGPGGEDHEVRGLETGGELVEVLEAAGEPGDVGAGLVEVADPLEGLDERVLEEDELAVGAPLGELEDELLRASDELLRLALPVPARPGALAARAGEGPPRRGSPQ